MNRLNNIAVKPKRLQKLESIMKLDYNSDTNKKEKPLSVEDSSTSSKHPVCQSVQNSRQGQRFKPPANPKSADIYLNKPKAH